MKIFLSILAALIVLLGVTQVGMWIWFIALDLRSSESGYPLIEMVFILFNALVVIIGIKFLVHQDTRHARGIAAIVGFVVWAVLAPEIGETTGRLDVLNVIYVFGPLVGGFLVYRIFFWWIQKAMDREQNKPPLLKRN